MKKLLTSIALTCGLVVGCITSPLGTLGVASAEMPPSYDTQWGSQGSGQGQFDNARAIALDENNSRVYVAERWNGRVQKFTINGAYQGQITGLTSPKGVAVDNSGNLFVVESNKVRKFSSSGSQLASWGSIGSSDNQIGNPNGIAVAPNGDVYVADTGNYRIQHLNNNLVRQGSFGFFGNGAGDYEFKFPRGVAVGDNGNVYVMESGSSQVKVYTSGGSSFVTKWGSFGSSPGQFSGSYGIGLDDSGNVYVADTGNSRMQKFSSAGSFLSQWNSVAANSSLSQPKGVAADTKVYVADSENNRVVVYEYAAPNVPYAPNCIVPNVLVSPDGSLDYVVTVRALDNNPVVNALTSLSFTPEADGMMCWCPSQAHPVITAITDTQGKAHFFIAAGGCLDPDSLMTEPVTVISDNTFLAKVGVVSVDIVDSARLRAHQGWSPECLVDLTDAVAFTIPWSQGVYDFCADLNSDGACDIGDVSIGTIPISISAVCQP